MGVCEFSSANRSSILQDIQILILFARIIFSINTYSNTSLCDSSSSSLNSDGDGLRTGITWRVMLSAMDRTGLIEQ